jgi:hypothetical protein
LQQQQERTAKAAVTHCNISSNASGLVSNVGGSFRAAVTSIAIVPEATALTTEAEFMNVQFR